MGRLCRFTRVLLLGWLVTGAGGGRGAEPGAELDPRRRVLLEAEARSLDEQFYRYDRDGDYARALHSAERALTLRESLYPPSNFPRGHPALALSLNNLAYIHQARAEYDRAQPLFERALAMREGLYPAERYPQGHPELAASVINLATLHQARGDLDKALMLFERALTIYEGLYPAERYPQGHPELATSLNNLAALHNERGEPDKALTLLERAHAIYEGLYPAERYPQGHPQLAMSLNNLAYVHQGRGDYGRALALYERSLAMREALYPKDHYPQGHPYLAIGIINLGRVHEARGDYGKALPLLERAVGMCEVLYSKERYPQGHPQLAVCVNLLAGLHQSRGDYGRALPLAERALAICEGLYPKDRQPHGHPDLAAAINNLAALHRTRGDYGRALLLYERALGMVEALYPKERYPHGHPYLAVCVNHVAELYMARGEYGQALPLYERALAMREALYPKDRYPHGHPELASTLGHLANLHGSRGDYEKALPFYERALAMREALYAKDRYPHGHPELAASVYGLARLYGAKGDYEKSLSLFERALAMYEALYPKDRYPHGHPDLAEAVAVVALLYHARGDYGRALPLYERALDLYHSFAMTVAEVSSEAEALNLLASFPGVQDAFLALPRDSLKADNAYAPVWRGKAAIARLLARRHRDAQAALDRGTRELFDRLRDTRRRLARLLLVPADPAHDTAAEVAALTADKERLERDLARALRGASRDPGRPADLVRRLPAGTAFVDLRRAALYDYNSTTLGMAGIQWTRSYTGFVLCQGRPLRRVDLGPAKPIDDAVTAWRRELLAGGESPTAETVRRLVWDPLARHLPPDTKVVYLAPDDALASLPWAALPGRNPGTVLLEEYSFAVVPNGPTLLDALRPRDRRPPGDGALLTVGGVTYDRTAAAAVAPTDGRGLEPARAAERGSGVRWGELKATGPEAAHVATLAAPRKVVPLAGADAGVARLTAELPGARWAHLATHGFFADPQFRSAFQLDERLYQRTTLERATPGARSPLVLSGLVLAGANRPDPDGKGDGGILTAEAIVGLDLAGLDLAVLSACETGLGEVAGGEGVYGLQRAFHLAGCRDVVASLWKVNDEATAALMAVFYRKLWRENLPPLEALRQAQLTIYRHPEQIKDLAERGWDVGKTEKLPAASTNDGEQGKARAPAKLWAAFVLSGPGRDFP